MSSARVVCLGEAILDLVGARPAPSLAQVGEFVPAPGGSLANIACVAARYGAPASLVGGAGGDEWGAWLRDRIAAEGVDVSCFRLVGRSSSIAFIAHSEDGEPDFHVHEAGERPAAGAAADLEQALAAGMSGVLVLGSDTLLGAAEREVTMDAARLARERGWLVLADPNLRPGRWEDRQQMLEAVAALVAGASVVKCNGAEAGELTGEDDDEGAARALLRLGPTAAVVTRSGRGALLARAQAPVAAIPAPEVERVVDATGAGDSVTGVLAAALALGAGADALEPALAVAMSAAAGVVASRGALQGLPDADQARAALESALGGRG